MSKYAGDPYGHGPTPRAAIKDLAEKRRRRAENRPGIESCADVRRELLRTMG